MSTPLAAVERTLRSPTGLRVLSHGSGPAILLIGGFADAASAWEPQLASLRSEHRVIRYDPRGIGESATPPGPYRFDELVKDAVEVLDTIEADAVHVVGSSLGGAIAQRLTLDHPTRVESLTLSGSWASPDRALRALLSGWVWAAERASGVEELLHIVNRWTYGTKAWNTGAVDERIARAAVTEARANPAAWRSFRDAFVWTAWAALEHDSRERLAEIAVPVLLISGAEDPILGEDYSRQLGEQLLDSRLEVIPEAGHQPFQEQPELFNGLLREFLTRVEKPRTLVA